MNVSFPLVKGKFLPCKLLATFKPQFETEAIRTERSIRTSLLLLSSVSRSTPIRSISSYTLKTLTRTSFASSSAASSCSSTVSSMTSSECISARESVRVRCGLRVSCCCRSSRRCRERSAPADAHGICARMSSCELRHFSWNSYDTALSALSRIEIGT
jgi:hypothetical protein